MTPAPLIVTPSLSLRPFVLEDAPKVFAMSREPGLRRWLPDQVYADESEAREVLRRLMALCADPGTPHRAPFVLGVCLAPSPEVIGHVGLSPRLGQVEIGYAIEEKHQGRGFATEAVEAVSGWAMRRFGLPGVLGIVATENAPSCRVLERAGFGLVDEAPGSLHGRHGLVRTYARGRAGASR